MLVTWILVSKVSIDAFDESKNTILGNIDEYTRLLNSYIACGDPPTTLFHFLSIHR
jgi:hypothetical protein